MREYTHDGSGNLGDAGGRTRAPGKSMLTDRLQRKARPDAQVTDGAAAAVDRAASSSGEPLRDDVRTQFEGSLGADLSAVRVHTGEASEASAAAVGARAYTVGNDIHFGAGQYGADDPFGLHLLAHEVAHTQQQAGGSPNPQYKLEVSSSGDAAEAEADHAADAMLGGHAFQLSGGAAGAIQRKESGAGDSTETQIDDLFRKLDNTYQALFETQVMALDNLNKDHDKADQPSFTETVLTYAVEQALGLAAGKIGAMIGGAVGNSLKGFRGLSDAEAAAGMDGNVGGDAATAAADADHAKKIADWLSGKVETGLKFGGSKAAKALAPSMPSFDAFYEAQKKALIDTKLTAQDALVDARRTFGGESGVRKAAALLDAVRGQYAYALGVQYLESLGQWWQMHGCSPLEGGGGQGRICVDVACKSPPSSQPQFTAIRLPGLNQAMAKRLKTDPNIAGQKLSAMNMPFEINITSEAFGDIVGDGMGTIKADGGGALQEWPSGSVAEWLYAHQTGHDSFQADPDYDPGDKKTIPMVQCAVIMSRLVGSTWAELAAIIEV